MHNVRVYFNAFLILFCFVFMGFILYRELDKPEKNIINIKIMPDEESCSMATEMY